MEKERYTLIFKTNKNYYDRKKYILILDKTFFKRNKNWITFIVDNRKIILREKIFVNNPIEDKIKIKMIINKKTYNKSYMFKNCEDLLSVSFEYKQEKSESEEWRKMEELANENDDQFINNFENENLIDNYNDIISGKNLVFIDNNNYIGNISSIKKEEKDNNFLQPLNI